MNTLAVPHPTPHATGSGAWSRRARLGLLAALACLSSGAPAAQPVHWTASPDVVFAQMDIDGNGALSRREVEAAEGRFDELDEDEDERVTLDELTQRLMAIRTAMSKKRLAMPDPRQAGQKFEQQRRYPSPDGFVPTDVVFGGGSTASFRDPEFLAGGSRMTFQDTDNAIWIAELDPKTGALRSETGRDVLVDTDIAPFNLSANGPEWAVSRNGTSLVYTKQDARGVPQVWQALLPDGGAPQVRQLTFRRTWAFSPFASISPGAPTTGIGYAVRVPEYTAYLVDIDVPGEPLVVPKFWIANSAIRWATNTQVVYSMYRGLEPSVKTEIALADMTTGEVRVVTDDGGDKMDVFGFAAPEFGGEMLYASNPDHEAIVIYRDTPGGKGFAQPIARLELPADSPYRYIYSFEPVDGLRGSRTTYFTMIANARNSAPLASPGDCSIWILGFGSDPDSRVARRLDDGGVTGEPALRYEPEPWVGRDEVFVYYNTGDGLRLTRTGVRSDGTLMDR